MREKRTPQEYRAAKRNYRLTKRLVVNNYFFEEKQRVIPAMNKRYAEGAYRCFKCGEKSHDHDHYPSCKKCFEVGLLRYDQ